MEHVEELLKHDPDIKVIYSVRDPRGIINSRFNVNYKYPKSLVNPNSLCSLMAHDLKLFHELKLRHPNSLYLNYYEKLAVDPVGVSDDIYRFLGVPKSPAINDWIKKMKTGKDGSVFGTDRENPEKTAYAWKTSMKVKDINNITITCRPVLSLLGYDTTRVVQPRILEY